MCLSGTSAHGHQHSHGHSHEHGGGVSRRALFTGGAAAALLAAMPASPARASGNIADLTHTLTAGFPVYGLANPTKETVLTISEDGVYMQSWTMGEHTGTHVDVPGHFVTGGRLLDEITPAELVLPAEVINISSRVASNPDTQVTVADIQQHETTYGQIPTGSVVFMYSGWESRLPLGQTTYRGQDANGVFHFPGWSVEAVEWLLNNRGISSVGVDTLSLDHGPSTTFDVHNLLLGDADRIGLENVARLNTIPRSGAYVTIGAIPLEDGSGGPCRLLAGW
ncbi:MAG TPA: cyclase family protein [Micromonosporaceae bacterium]|nr:cyclase family protein [Micromonosporaceae bacterium]